MTEPDQPSLFNVAIAVGRVETKLDMLLTVQSQHGKDIRALQERRWPLPVVSACIAAGGLAALVIPHLK